MPAKKRKKRGHSKLEREELLLTHMLYSFIVAALAFIVPLYLLEMQVDITLIGLILALGPLSFLTLRIFMATIADDIGTKTIAVLYSLLNAVAVLLYAFFAVPIGFAMAAIAEGTRGSGFWAIARTETFEFNGNRKNPGSVLAHFANMRQLADGIGRLAAGLLLAYLAFSGAFAVMFALSALLIILALISTERSLGGFRFDDHILKRVFKDHPASFWHAALLLVLLLLPFELLPAFLLPLFMAGELGLGYAEIGIAIAIFSIASAAFALIFMKLELSKKGLLALMAVSVPALASFPFGLFDGLLLIIVLAVGKGCANVITEYILTDEVCRSKDRSTDVATLMGPLQIAEFLFLALAGLTIAHFGFVPLFAVFALSVGLFVLLGLFLMRRTMA